MFHRIKKMFWLWSDVDSWSSNNVKYSYWGRTYFIIVSGFVQLNINIHSHVWFSDILIIERHMLWFLWITVLTTIGGIPQGFVLGDGVCANYHDETVYAEMKEIVISHPQFCSNPICCCCFFPCETQKNYFKRVFTQVFYTYALHLTVILQCYWSLLELDRLGHCRPTVDQGSAMFNFWQEWKQGCEEYNYSALNWLYCCLTTFQISSWNVF